MQPPGLSSFGLLQGGGSVGSQCDPCRVYLMLGGHVANTAASTGYLSGQRRAGCQMAPGHRRALEPSASGPSPVDMRGGGRSRAPARQAGLAGPAQTACANGNSNKSDSCLGR